MMEQAWGESVVRRVLTEKVIFEQRVEGVKEEISHVDLSGKCFPRRGKSRCSGSEMGACLSCSKNSKETGMVRAE